MRATTGEGGSGRRDEVICVRTNTYDAHLDRFIEEALLPSGRHVALLADERAGPLNAPPHRDKVVLDPVAAGLFMTGDAMWRCGDYCLYAAAAAFPEARHVWLVEPDVRIHAAEPARLFDGAEGAAATAADFITAWFVTASPGWSWYGTIAPFFPTTCNCMLQLARFSRPLIESCLEARLALSRRFVAEGRDPAGWPNDESFIGAIAHSPRFRVATLAEHAPGFSTAGTFTFLRPTSGRHLERLPPDGRIYHPVLYGESFAARARLFLNERVEASRDPAQFVSEVSTAFLLEVAAELGPAAAAAFYEEVRAAARRLERRERVPAA